MGDPSGSPSQSATGPSPFWRIRHSPVMSGAAILRFIVPSVLWLIAFGLPWWSLWVSGYGALASP
jgi:hypothetical protein